MTLLLSSVSMLFTSVSILILLLLLLPPFFFSSPLETFFFCQLLPVRVPEPEIYGHDLHLLLRPGLLQENRRGGRKKFNNEEKATYLGKQRTRNAEKKIRKMRGCLPPSASFDDCTFSSASGIFRRFVSRKQFNYLRMGATYFKEATDIKCRKGQWEGGMKYIMWNFFLSQNGFLEKFRASLQNCVFGR